MFDIWVPLPPLILKLSFFTNVQLLQCFHSEISDLYTIALAFSTGFQ